jgi:hypothetical protein
VQWFDWFWRSRLAQRKDASAQRASVRRTVNFVKARAGNLRHRCLFTDC